MTQSDPPHQPIGADALSRPNIVVIMADQLRWDALGCYGTTRVRTPHLDALAAGGVLVENAFVPVPLCIPSRAALFTGRYPDRRGLGPRSGYPLPADAPNLAGMLRASGYRTMLVGKDHLFGDEGLARCFDHVVRYDHAGRAEDEDADADECAVRASRAGRFDEPFIEGAAYDIEAAPTRRLTTAAIDAVRDAHDRQHPFFLWLSYPDPHPPYVVPEPYASMYSGEDVGMPATRPGELDDKPLRQRLARQLMDAASATPADVQRLREIYFGMVSFIDDEVGRFLGALDDAGIAERTIVVVLSDHGDYLGDHDLVRKSPAMYDCLVRIPLLIHWPGHLQPQRVSDTLVESIELAPTLLDLAGLPSLPCAEGTSLASLLRGATDRHKGLVFGLYGSGGEATVEADLPGVDFRALAGTPHPWMGELTMRGRMAMARSVDWKLVAYQGGEGELYDLRHDPNELVNRYADPACATVRADLLHALVDFLLDSPPAP